jgi:hypothetical protein
MLQHFSSLQRDAGWLAQPTPHRRSVVRAGLTRADHQSHPMPARVAAITIHHKEVGLWMILRLVV